MEGKMNMRDLTGYMVYFYDSDLEQSGCDLFESLNEALASMEGLRKLEHMQFVTMVSKIPDMVGNVGADMIKNGILPNGKPYDYTINDTMEKHKYSDIISDGGFDPRNNYYVD